MAKNIFYFQDFRVQGNKSLMQMTYLNSEICLFF